MNIAIDIGNSLAKAAVIENGQVLDIFKVKDMTSEYITSNILSVYPDITNCIMISTREHNTELEQFLSKIFQKYIYFDHPITRIPIKNLYLTPATLGCDRLAAAVGAHAIHPGSNIMIVDFGTAITIDFLTAKGEFLGGNISPGAETRFRALHEFTGRLPLRSLTENTELIGKSSFSAIESGVINGIIFEIEGYISRFSKEFSNFRIIFTGGDGNFFAKRLKNPIFATCDLVLYGLNKILENNV